MAAWGPMLQRIMNSRGGSARRARCGPWRPDHAPWPPPEAPGPCAPPPASGFSRRCGEEAPAGSQSPRPGTRNREGAAWGRLPPSPASATPAAASVPWRPLSWAADGPARGPFPLEELEWAGSPEGGGGPGRSAHTGGGALPLPTLARRLTSALLGGRRRAVEKLLRGLPLALEHWKQEDTAVPGVLEQGQHRHQGREGGRAAGGEAERGGEDHGNQRLRKLLNAMLNGCAMAGNAEAAKAVLSAMRQAGVDPDSTTALCYVRALCKGGLKHQALLWLQAVATPKAGGAQLPVQHAGPSTLARASAVGAAAGGVAPSARPFNAVLNQCARDRDLASALQCVGAMTEAGVALDLLSHVELIKLCGQRGDGQGVWQWWTSLGRAFPEEQLKSLLARSALLVALSRVPGTAALAEAQAQLQSLLALAQSPELSLQGLRAGRGQGGGRERAGAPWQRSGEHREAEGAPPAALVSEDLAQERLAGLLGAMGRPYVEGPGSQALRGIQGRQAEGVATPEDAGRASMAPRLRAELRAACNAVLNAIAREGDLARAIDVLSQMHAAGLGADSFTTNALLRACFRADNLAAAMAVVAAAQRWKAAGPGDQRGAEVLQDSLIIGLCSLGHVAQAKALFDRATALSAAAEHAGAPPPNRGAVARAGSSHWDRASASRSSTPSMPACNALMLELIRQGEAESALGVLRRSLKAQAHAADACTVQAMLRLCQTDIYGDAPAPGAPQGQLAVQEGPSAAPAWTPRARVPGIPKAEGRPPSNRLAGAWDAFGDRAGAEDQGEEEQGEEDEGEGEEGEEAEEEQEEEGGGVVSEDMDERSEAWRAMRQSDVIARIEAVDDFMTIRGLKHTRASFATLVSVLAREGLHDEMMARVEEAMASAPPPGSLNPIPPPEVQALAPHVESSARGAGAAWATPGAQEHPVLDTAAANIALRALASEGKVALVRELLDDMRALGLGPDCASYNCLLQALARQAQLAHAEGDRRDRQGQDSAVDAALRIFEEMRATGIDPDAMCYSTLVQIACASGRLGLAASLVAAMQKGVPARGDDARHLSAAYGRVIASAAREGLHAPMEESLRQAVAAGVGLRRDTCACIVESYAAAGKHALALEALRVLPVLQVVHAQSRAPGELLPRSAEALLGELEHGEALLEALHPGSTPDGPHLDEAAPEPSQEDALAFASWSQEGALAFASWSHALVRNMAPEVFKCNISQLKFARRIVHSTS